MPEQFENDRKLDGKNSLQDFDAKEVYLHPKNRSVSFHKRLKMFCFHHFRVFTRCRFSKMCRLEFRFQIYHFQNLPAEMCRFRVNGRPIRRIFHRFQNVPASCERSLRVQFDFEDLFLILNASSESEIKEFPNTCFCWLMKILMICVGMSSMTSRPYFS